jgi:hypothetical protein
MKITFDKRSIDSYRQFLRCRDIPVHRFIGGSCEVPDEYAAMIDAEIQPTKYDHAYEPSSIAFDYQVDIVAMALKKKKFAIFADCGLGKTLMILEFVRHVMKHRGGRGLIVSPLMVCKQTIDECERFYGDSMPIQRLTAKTLQDWLASGQGVGVVNFEAIKDDLKNGALSVLVIDESSMLKSHYGAWGTRLIELGRGVEYKLCATGTPAPNDRIEFANHAVFLDRAKTVHEFLATYFINRGETQNRWELKPHALRPFYKSLSDWSIFLSDPSVYGWKDNVRNLPPINVHIHEVELTSSQRSAAMDVTGNLITTSVGGIGDRGKLSRIAKGKDGIESKKNDFIRSLIDSWPDESTIIWCNYNDEQDAIAKMLPDAANIDGSTPENKRQELVDDFKSGRRKVLITKPKILGFGLNLQVATRQIWSGLKDSYEEYYQGVKRSNRIGSSKPLNVHIPVTELEVPFVENVLRKAHRVESDTNEQQLLFREMTNAFTR